ncbi:MAG: hypothetical protein RLZZ306_99 [Bacteroidota bacterium]|jgi:hypothetical protein
MQQVKDFQDFKQTLQNDKTLQKAFQDDPKAAIEKISDGSFIPDNWIYRIVVGSLGLVIIIITLGIVWRVAFGQPMDDKSVPTILTAIGSAAIGALAGLLAPSPNRG